MVQQQEQPANLQALALEFFQATGAVVEVENGLINVLLPDGYAQKLAVPDGDLLSLAFDPQVAESHPQAQLVALGSPLADRLITLAGEVGVTAHLFVNGLKWSGQRSIRLEQWKATFANARFLPRGVEMLFAGHYVALSYLVSYISDEKREEVRTVVVDSSSLQPAPRELLERARLSPQREFYVTGADQLPDAERLRLVFQRAGQLVQRQIADQIAVYRRRAARHLEGESLRIGSFYDDTEADLRKRLARAEDERRQQALALKIEANRLERERKLADVHAKHRLRVVLTPLSGALITQPKVRTSVKVENRYAVADLAVIFDPLTGALELPTCQVCLDPAPVVYLCAGGHIACERCILACDLCKRQYCRHCGMAQCAVCGRAVCAHSQVICAACGQVTCADHRGQCHQ